MNSNHDSSNSADYCPSNLIKYAGSEISHTESEASSVVSTDEQENVSKDFLSNDFQSAKKSKLSLSMSSESTVNDRPRVRRGRPKASSLPELKEMGRMSNSTIRCNYCHRDFPRLKSLTAHVRTHTKEKPYKCTYPGCEDVFTQSSHLVNHIRIHTCEMPFICPAEGCGTRFKHRSRRCKIHELPLKNYEGYCGIEEVENFSDKSEEEQEWLKNYFLNKENKITGQKRKQEHEIKNAQQEHETNKTKQEEGFSDVLKMSNVTNRTNVLEARQLFLLNSQPPSPSELITATDAANILLGMAKGFS